ncbi:MAG: hypothetical protein ACI9YT_000405 [Halobacteriales archaeon]|jgi:hypothetical protein
MAGLATTGLAAAGNDGPCTDYVSYPGGYSTVMAVGATTESDTLADFSSTGREVEIAAPGKDVSSTYYEESYETLSGTSMACPHVAGGAQLMANGYTNTEARDRLAGTVEGLGLASNEQGTGRWTSRQRSDWTRATTDDGAGRGRRRSLTTGRSDLPGSHAFLPVRRLGQRRMASEERNEDGNSERTNDGNPATETERPPARDGDSATGRIDDMPEELDEGGESGEETEGVEEAPVEIEPLDTPIEAGTIDPENAVFVVLGIVLTVLVVVRFLSVLP